MVSIEIHNSENVKIITNDPDFAAYIDNKGNVKTRFQQEGSILLLGKLNVLKDITDYFN